MSRLAILFATLAVAAPAPALDLSLPSARVVRTETEPAGQIRLPVGPWSPGVQPNVETGAIRREVLRVPGAARTPLQLLAGLRAELEESGFEEVFSCASRACGGFDFRFQIDIIGEPDMHVDLGDYLYVVMRAADAGDGPHTVALLASRSRAAGFVHIMTISDAETPPPAPEPSPDPAEAAGPEPADASGDLVETLTEAGHAVLPDLDFGSGSAELGGGPYASLETLAAWLGRNPSARIVLVGHTDSVGSLDANTALSRQRAASAARYLTAELGVDPAQIQSSGAGYLSPVASNLTPDGRAANRRVEVVLLSLDE